MSLATPISNVEVLSSAATRVTWTELRQVDLAAWNDALLKTEASLYQYPFWNEPYRRMWVTPRYLVWGSEHRPLAFASILTIGFGPAKIGLVFRGPTAIVTDLKFSRAMCQELINWARTEGYIFLRFTHSDPEVLTDLASVGKALDYDAFPYLLDYPVMSQDYMVPQTDSDEETLASFDREARRKIRRGTEIGYQIKSDTAPEALEQVWPLYEECARRKHFRLERPLSFYMDLMREAQSYDRARLYTVSIGGVGVGSALVFRDQTVAHCQLAAFDAEHRHSASLLHWHAMRDMHRKGARKYNLGPGPGSLARFKSQFCVSPVHYPAPLTIVLKDDWFQIWKRGFLPMAKQLQPMLRKIAFQRGRLSRKSVD